MRKNYAIFFMNQKKVRENLWKTTNRKANCVKPRRFDTV